MNMHPYNSQFYTRVFRLGLLCCVLLLIIIGAAHASLITRGPLMWLTLGFLLATALRQAALLAAIRRWERRGKTWFRRSASG